MSKRMFDDSFKKMAIDLSNSRGSVKEVAAEFDINHSLLSKCRQQGSESQQIPAVLSEVDILEHTDPPVLSISSVV